MDRYKKKTTDDTEKETMFCVHLFETILSVIQPLKAKLLKIKMPERFFLDLLT